LRTSIGCG